MPGPIEAPRTPFGDKIRKLAALGHVVTIEDVSDLSWAALAVDRFEQLADRYEQNRAPDSIVVSRLTLEWIIRKTADKRNPQVAFVCQKLLDGDALSALRHMGDNPATPSQ